MPEYLAPGVYVEEVSFRQKSIEGVSTSVAGFVGPTRYGPAEGTPELLTSFSDFERIYGGIDRLLLQAEDGSESETENYLAHAVQAFFGNGGARLYVTRVYQEPAGGDGRASLGPSGSPPNPATSVDLVARFPGRSGNMRITFGARVGSNAFSGNPERRLTAIRKGDVVLVVHELGSPVPSAVDLMDVPDDVAGFVADLAGTDRVHKVTLTATVRREGSFEDEASYEALGPAPGSANSILDIFVEKPQSRARFLSIPFWMNTGLTSGADIVRALTGPDIADRLGAFVRRRDELTLMSPPATRPLLSDLDRTFTLEGGADGGLPTPQAYRGEDDGDAKTGLKTFEDIDEISIVAAPGATAAYGKAPQRADAIMQELIGHCQIIMKYRVAVLESGDDQILSEVRDLRGRFDSTHAALYYPWVKVADPLDPTGRNEISVSPAGFVSGIYARTDVLHGVFKAPANEVAIGAIDFERILNKAEQDVLNPLGINCFRFFEGRGFRLWGARTISSDPEWKYISVRRYFAYLEHSIDRGTQWAVFENNSEPLWKNVRLTIEDFLTSEWRNGALMGTRPEDAFFVRCDRTTMTQNDFDNGRLVCLVGVAVVKPAEFVIFRIGQMTADSRR